jgi:NarL family two-component system response regulator LiaR
VTIDILIPDDHEVVRQGLRTLLELDAGLKVVGQASDGSEAVELVRQLGPDIVLMDLVMPGMDGLGATGASVRKYQIQTWLRSRASSRTRRW